MSTARHHPANQRALHRFDNQNPTYLTLFLIPIIERFFRTVIAIVGIAAGVYTFGDALLFDRLYILTIIAVAIVVRKDINLIAVVMLLALQRINEELGYILVGEHHQIFKVGVYCLLATACYFLRKDALWWLLAPLLVLCLGAEIFWLLAHYRAPVISWHLFLIINAVLIRKLVWQRELWTKRRYPKLARSLDIDYYVYELNLLYICANTAVILEYLGRHLLRFSESLLIYHAFPYTAHTMTVLTLILLIDQTITNLNARRIKI